MVLQHWTVSQRHTITDDLHAETAFVVTMVKMHTATASYPGVQKWPRLLLAAQSCRPFLEHLRISNFIDSCESG